MSKNNIFEITKPLQVVQVVGEFVFGSRVRLAKEDIQMAEEAFYRKGNRRVAAWGDGRDRRHIGLRTVTVRSRVVRTKEAHKDREELAQGLVVHSSQTRHSSLRNFLKLNLNSRSFHEIVNLFNSLPPPFLGGGAPGGPYLSLTPRGRS